MIIRVRPSLSPGMIGLSVWADGRAPKARVDVELSLITARWLRDALDAEIKKREPPQARWRKKY